MSDIKYWVIKNGLDRWIVRESAGKPLGVIETLGPYKTLKKAKEVKDRILKDE